MDTRSKRRANTRNSSASATAGSCCRFFIWRPSDFKRALLHYTIIISNFSIVVKRCAIKKIVSPFIITQLRIFVNSFVDFFGRAGRHPASLRCRDALAKFSMTRSYAASSHRLTKSIAKTQEIRYNISVKEKEKDTPSTKLERR